jgi:hypothetical protein
MAASTRVAHHVPGRMRIHVHGAKQNPRLLEQVKDSVSATEGVRHVEAHPATGSLVIHYRDKSPKQFGHALSEQGRSTQAFNLSVPELGEAGEMWRNVEREADFLAAHSQLARSVVQETKHLDIEVKLATNNTLDLKVLVPLGLAVFSIMYLGSDISTPLWLSLGVFSFNSFVSLHPPLPCPPTEDQAFRGNGGQG